MSSQNVPKPWVETGGRTEGVATNAAEFIPGYRVDLGKHRGSRAQGWSVRHESMLGGEQAGEERGVGGRRRGNHGVRAGERHSVPREGGHVGESGRQFLTVPA